MPVWFIKQVAMTGISLSTIPNIISVVANEVVVVIKVYRYLTRLLGHFPNNAKSRQSLMMLGFSCVYLMKCPFPLVEVAQQKGRLCW